MNLGLILFTFCGDEASSNNIADSAKEEHLNSDIDAKDSLIKEVSTIYELGKCSAEKENFVAFVVDENADYICRNGEWFDLTSIIKQSSSSLWFEQPYSSEKKSSSSNRIISSSEKQSSSSVLLISSSDVAKSSSSVLISSSSDVVESSSSYTIIYGELIDSRDEKHYKTVRIGTQTWMAENLNYESPSGMSIEPVAGSENGYGRLYWWADVLDSVKLAEDDIICSFESSCVIPQPVQGICPNGWHIPTRAEWQTLLNFIINDQSTRYGSKPICEGIQCLFSENGWLEGDDNKYKRGKNEYGFSLKAAGDALCSKKNSEDSLSCRPTANGNSARFVDPAGTVPDYFKYNSFSVTSFYYDNKDMIQLYSELTQLGRKFYGYYQSVRCLKDEL